MAKPNLLKKRRARQSQSMSRAKPEVDVPIVTTLGSSKNELVSFSQITLDPRTQPRVELDSKTLDEYSERMKMDDRRGLVVDLEDVPWDDIRLFRDSDDRFWLADGYHRIQAGAQAGLESFQATISAGGLRDAIEYSLRANARHGKRRTNEDKWRAVQNALEDEEWGAYSDKMIAQMCLVTRRYVGKVRQKLQTSGAIEARSTRVGADGEIHEVQNIESTSIEAGTDAQSERVGETAIRHVDSLDEVPSDAQTILVAYDDEFEFKALASRISALEHTPRHVGVCFEPGQPLDAHVFGSVLKRRRWPSPRARLVWVKDPAYAVMLWTTKTEIGAKHLGSLASLDDQQDTIWLVSRNH